MKSASSCWTSCPETALFQAVTHWSLNMSFDKSMLTVSSFTDSRRHLPCNHLLQVGLMRVTCTAFITQTNFFSGTCEFYKQISQLLRFISCSHKQTTSICIYGEVSSLWHFPQFKTQIHPKVSIRTSKNLKAKSTPRGSGSVCSKSAMSFYLAGIEFLAPVLSLLHT